MDPPDLVAGLPEPVRVIRTSSGVLAVREDLADAFLDAGFAPGDRPRPARADAVGKRPLGSVSAAGREFLVRRFHHGGLLRWLTGVRFASPRRPFDEWRLQAHLRELGVPTPAVVAARAQRAWPAGWRLDLATERVDDAVDLGELL
ncbi:MAG TPA: lipopolysaccharide kinase InaA family protein, partial [Planctomycetota bacterium]|nr:lipopolysaccharide kinase InaA family protein [Planctomycetota bacterium]